MSLDVPDVPFGTKLNKRLAEKTEQILSRRYCSSHQGMATLEGGVKQKNRWLCGACVQNRRSWLSSRQQRT